MTPNQKSKIDKYLSKYVSPFTYKWDNNAIALSSPDIGLANHISWLLSSQFPEYSHGNVKVKLTIEIK